MSSTKEKVGIGAVAVAVIGLVTAVVTFADNHWDVFHRSGTSVTQPSGGAGPAGGGAPAGGGSGGGTVPPAQATDIYLSKESVPAGGTVDISGEGFAPGQVVVVTVGTFEVARPTSNAQGGFKNLRFTIPSFYDPFQKPMTVTVAAMSKEDISKRATRQVTLT